MLADKEQFREALAVVDTALQRVTNPPLRAARASLLRDLGQRHLAVVELRGLERDLPSDEIDPVLRFELAQLEWLEGDTTAAMATVQRLQVLGANSPWLAGHRAEVDALVAALQRGGPPKIVLIRDLLANLRGAGTVAARMAMLAWLLEGKDLEPDLARELHVRALAIASGDESAAVRARAVQNGVPDADFAFAFYSDALADEAALVRRCAAPRLAALLPESAVPLLRERLGVESDAMAFLAMHVALASLRPAPVQCAENDADDPAARARIAAAWQVALEKQP